jgi:hypothetical protein
MHSISSGYRATPHKRPNIMHDMILASIIEGVTRQVLPDVDTNDIPALLQPLTQLSVFSAKIGVGLKTRMPPTEPRTYLLAINSQGIRFNA